MVLSPKVSVSPGGIHGFCWFAASDIAVGEMIWEYGEGVVYHDIDISVSELQKWTEEKRNKFLDLAYMVDENTYRGSDPNREIPQWEQNEYYVNHSCDGNCWYVGNKLLISKREIKKGEEICYDYALTECNPTWILAEKCLCGEKRCRGKVTGNDWKRKDLQEEYGEHFETHILELIKKEQEKEKEKEEKEGKAQ